MQQQGLVENPTGPEAGSSRVLRGDDWGGFARNCRSALRNFADPSYRRDRVGFRPVFLP